MKALLNPKLPTALLALLVLFHGCTTPPAQLTPPVEKLPAVSTGGMVVSDAALATRTGVEVLDHGGNAIDAAVATAFALAVAYPEAGNIGGGGFLVARLSNGTVLALDFREKAPLAATEKMYLDQKGSVTEESQIGPLAAGVPGTVAGLWEAHQKYGALSWRQVVAPAIRIAREGFAPDRRMVQTLRADSSRLVRFKGSRELFFTHALSEGQIWKNPDLAATLDRIADHGMAGFYSGPTAEMIVEEMTKDGGILTLEDLKSYTAIWRNAIQINYRGNTIISMPPPSSGGVTLALICNILSGYDLRSIEWHSPKAIHLTAEAMRRAFAIRNEYLGDPDFVPIPIDTLLSPQFALEQRSTISSDRASPSSTISTRLGAGSREPRETTHLSVVDAQGNAVSLTTTLNGLYGNAVTVEGAGFLLNNEMDDFAAKPGFPNMFGLVQGEANAIAPGKRMLSSMTPTIVLDSRSAPLLLTGARGGPYIISAIFQVLSNIIDYGMDLPNAVIASRVHHQHLPDSLEFEERGMPEETLKQLHALGYETTQAGGLGSAPSILRQNNRWIGFADPRSGGTAEGQSRLP